MNWLEIGLWILLALGFIAGGYLYFLKVRANPLIIFGLIFGWLQAAWPTIKTIAIRVALYLLKSSPETQARAREESRHRDEPGRGKGPER